MSTTGKVTVTATFGEVVCTPVPYHAFRVGPFSMTVECEAGGEQKALERAMTVLRAQAREEYKADKEFWHREWRVGERG
jgi:hypothetical protein